jgi:hypothetical protein
MRKNTTAKKRSNKVLAKGQARKIRQPAAKQRLTIGLGLDRSARTFSPGWIKCKLHTQPRTKRLYSAWVPIQIHSTAPDSKSPTTR